MFKGCTECKEYKRIPATENLCDSCRERSSMPQIRNCPTCQTNRVFWWGSGEDNNWYCEVCQLSNLNPETPLAYYRHLVQGVGLNLTDFQTYLTNQGKVNQLQTKLTQFLNKRKTQLLQEIQLIKEVLNE